MLITFIRHATAEEAILDLADADRRLVEKGIKQAKRVAKFCQAQRLLPELLLASPLRRAEQTAELLHTYLPNCPEVKTVDWLAISTPTAKLLKALTKLAEQNLDDIWLVGHEPDFSVHIAYLLQTNRAQFLIKKASLTRLEIEFSSPPKARLLWSIPCSLLR